METRIRELGVGHRNVDVDSKHARLVPPSWSWRIIEPTSRFCAVVTWPDLTLKRLVPKAADPNRGGYAATIVDRPESQSKASEILVSPAAQPHYRPIRLPSHESLS